MHSFSSGGSGRCSKIKKAKFVLASPFSISRHIVNIFGLLAGCQIHVFPRDSSSPLSPLGTQQVSAFEFHFFFLVSFHSRHFFVLRIHAHPNALSSVVYRLLFFLIFRFFSLFSAFLYPLLHTNFFHEYKFMDFFLLYYKYLKLFGVFPDFVTVCSHIR